MPRLPQFRPQNLLLKKLGRIPCRVLDRLYPLRLCFLFTILDIASGSDTITRCWGNIDYARDAVDPQTGFHFTARYKPDNTTQRLSPVVQILYAAQTVLAGCFCTLFVIYYFRAAGGIVPRWNLAMTGILITRTVLNFLALGLREIIIAVPLDVAAVVSKIPNVTPEVLHHAYHYWLRESEVLAALVVGLSGANLVVWLVYHALWHLHWAIRHQPMARPTSNTENLISTMDTIHLDQNGRSSSAGLLAALFEAHEEMRARELPRWMINEE